MRYTTRRLNDSTAHGYLVCVSSSGTADRCVGQHRGETRGSRCQNRVRTSPHASRGSRAGLVQAGQPAWLRFQSDRTVHPPRRSAVSRIGHRVIIRSPLGFCIYECIGCWNFHKGRAKNIRLLWGGGVFTMVPWAKILSDLNLVLTLHYRHCALASIASGGRYHSRSSRRCGRHRTKLNFKASTP